MIDKYHEIKNKFKDGDWIVGTKKHIGCSQVFDCNISRPQPFSYLLATDSEILIAVKKLEIAYYNWNERLT